MKNSFVGDPIKLNDTEVGMIIDVTLSWTDGVNKFWKVGFLTRHGVRWTWSSWLSDHDLIQGTP